VVVAHGVVIRVILTAILDGLGPADFERLAIDNAAVNDLRLAGRTWRAESLNRRLDPDPDRDTFAW
jgi:broad specificity phosphatase PhoE